MESEVNSNNPNLTICFNKETRFVLNQKKVAYRTEWVSYPDVEALWRKLGLSPLDQNPRCTLPVISIPSKDDRNPPTVIADSFNIALYLDHEYPDVTIPPVVPPNSAALQAGFVRLLSELLPVALSPLTIRTIIQRLDERGGKYYKESRTKWYGLHDLDEPLSTENREKYTKLLKKNLKSLRNILAANGSNGSWVMGSIGPTFADFVLGGHLLWIREMGEDVLWKEVSAWNNGKWAAHLKALEPWMDIH